ncbi:MAG: hypothetical protein ACKO01_09020 [Erythrobacter sp.]
MIAPPAGLAGSVHTFYVIETEAARIEEVLPAYSAQFVLLVRGQLKLTYADGREARLSGVAFNAPQMRGAASLIEGPLTLVAASLTPLGWQALANLPVDAVHDRTVPTPAVLTPDQIVTLEKGMAAMAAGAASAEDLCDHLAAVIGAAPFTPRPDHVLLVEAITRWLGSWPEPQLADLHAAIPVSPRQLQRISRRFFGVAPAQALKRHRAIRAAMLLAQPQLPETLRNEILGSYFDQAHLIRDIRR